MKAGFDGGVYGDDSPGKFTVTFLFVDLISTDGEVLHLARLRCRRCWFSSNSAMV